MCHLCHGERYLKSTELGNIPERLCFDSFMRLFNFQFSVRHNMELGPPDVTRHGVTRCH